MARPTGFEPVAYCLEGSCSIQLSYGRKCCFKDKKLERVMGIEPTRPAWKAGILPLNYTRTACRNPVTPSDCTILSDSARFVNGVFPLLHKDFLLHRESRPKGLWGSIKISRRAASFGKKPSPKTGGI